MILLITYDLNKPGKDYPDLYEAIKNLGAWWHHLDSTWLVDTSLTPYQAWSRLSSVVDKNDTVLVIRVTGDYSGWLTERAQNWLRERNY